VQTERKTEEAIFKAAIQLKTRAERAAYIVEACGDDQSLLAGVEALLEYHDASSFLDAPVLGAEVAVDDSALTEGPGTVIGRYKLLERIGEGGMAVVYMAEQAEPIRRKVALKIIKLGMDTKQVIARFEAERQALAIMDHPNIAKVLDAGATETGRPYFVMELVKGVSITEYCDKKKLSTSERLDLFIQVCNAVQHAHQKGIIHRDIKPTNVMVTLRDGKAVPKVIDFGIAKATSRRLTEKTLFTRYAHIIGTPAYMSPEQAEFSEVDIDTRTDIYSLGVLLYELLTGATPFSEEELREAGYVEMQRIIREVDPVKPSTRLTTLGETLPEVAEHRRATPDLLAKLVRGDLDWIVMKALEKDRTRRYETAAGLVEDVERHLNSEPVQAAAPSRLYRTRKFVRRHRVGVFAGVVVIGGLAVGLSVALVALSESNRQWRRAETNYQRARENLDDMYEFHWREISGVSEAEKLELYLGMYRKRQEFLNWSLQRDPADPAIRKELGDTHKYMGIVYLAELNKPEEAELAYRRAVSVFETLARDFPESPDYPTELGYLKKGLAAILQVLGRSQEAKEEHLASLKLLGSLCSPLSLDTPTNLGAVVNSTYDEVAPRMSADGLTLFFSSNRPGGSGGWDLWMAKRNSENGLFEAPENLGPKLNSPAWEDGPSISADGLSLFFCSTRPGGSGSFDLWVGTRKEKGDEWSTAVNLGLTVNTEYVDSVPMISSDALSLYFHSNRPGGSGGRDLWVSKRENPSDDFGEPENLGPIVNSPYGDVTPFVSGDGLMLFFASHRPGTFSGLYDLWAAERPNTSVAFGSPVNLGPVVNTLVAESAPALSPDGSVLLFSSKRPDGQGSWDLWQADITSPKEKARVNGTADSIGALINRHAGKEKAPGSKQ